MNNALRVPVETLAEAEPNGSQSPPTMASAPRITVTTLTAISTKAMTLSNSNGTLNKTVRSHLRSLLFFSCQQQIYTYWRQVQRMGWERKGHQALRSSMQRSY